MPYYWSLNNLKEADRVTASGLLRLRKALAAEIPAKTTDSTLILASWNLREFGGNKYGGRDREALFYIAEVISHFDLVAVQEVRDNLEALDDLMRLLGNWWDYLVTDVTAGAQGNHERLAFIFDRRKVSFGGLAGELTAAMVKSGQMLSVPTAFARSPYMAGFQAGWFKFSMCTGHLYYGSSTADDPQRLTEMRELVALLEKRVTQRDRWARNVVLLGDFNIFSTKDETFRVLTKVFKTHPAIADTTTNQDRTRAFDQMVFISPDIENHISKSKGGVFDFYKYVYQKEEPRFKIPASTKFKEWRTYQMSDHLPLWAEVQVDFSEEYLVNKSVQKP